MKQKMFSKRWLGPLLCLGLLTPVIVAGDDENPALEDPSLANEKAPETFRVMFETSKGEFTIKVTRAWSPLGADRFFNLVKVGYFRDIAFYRVIDGFMAQFGFSGDPEINKVWSKRYIKDDPPSQTNSPGRISFAKMRAHHTRATQFFINTVHNSFLDGMGFTPFGEVEGEGLEIVKKLYSGYGEGPPRGRGPNQSLVESQGRAYLTKGFAELDYILKATLVEE